MAVAKGVRTPAQVFALVIAIFYLVTGLAGFAAAGTGSGDVYGILGVNALQKRHPRLRVRGGVDLGGAPGPGHGQDRQPRARHRRRGAGRAPPHHLIV
jgi:hypothetical protein